MILKILKTKVNQITKTIKRDDSGINGKNKRLIPAVATTEELYININKKLSTYKRIFKSRLLDYYYRIKYFENIAAFYKSRRNFCHC